jgi:hypothetical protein
VKAADSGLEQWRFQFSLDVAAARTAEGVAPLPFAGEPRWSAEVRRVFDAAESAAREMGTPLGTAALLAALLRQHSLTQDVCRTLGRNPADAAKVLDGNPRKRVDQPVATANYETACLRARLAARTAGEFLVRGHHLLYSLLMTQSKDLDAKLQSLGLTPAKMLAALSTLCPEAGAGQIPSTTIPDIVGEEG